MSCVNSPLCGIQVDDVDKTSKQNLGVQVGEHKKEVEAKDKIHKTKQEVSRGTAKQICHHRPCNNRKPRDKLGPGESGGARI